VPRLAIFRSNKFIYAQLIDDKAEKTLVSSSDIKSYMNGKENKIESAKLVGKSLAEKAVKANVKKVVFDRGGFAYKGRVAALADGAREGGLEF
jgi:large subunit ribosomal protein L18